MNYEDKLEDLDFTSPADMTLSYMSMVREKIADAIEDHLDEYEPEDWGFYDKSKCYKTVQDILMDEAVAETHYQKLMDESEKLFETEMLFRDGMLRLVSTKN